MSPDLDRIGEPFTRHQRASLHFSGGKDSLACLLLLRPWWDQIVVTWCNTGDAFPETEELARRVQAAVPHFHEARSYVRPYIELAGWPVDALPGRHAESLGRPLNREERPPMQLYTDCCHQHIVTPLYLADLENAATLVIVGRRRADSGGKRSTLVGPGGLDQGLEYHLPIWEWTDAQVWEFLETSEVELPPHYRLAPESTSLDCMHCTAWWRDGSPGQLRVLGERYPDTHREVMRRLQVIRAGVAEELSHLDRLLEKAAQRGDEALWARDRDPGPADA